MRFPLAILDGLVFAINLLFGIGLIAISYVNSRFGLSMFAILLYFLLVTLFVLRGKNVRFIWIFRFLGITTPFIIWFIGIISG